MRKKGFLDGEGERDTTATGRPGFAMLFAATAQTGAGAGGGDAIAAD